MGPRVFPEVNYFTAFSNLTEQISLWVGLEIGQVVQDIRRQIGNPEF